MYRSQPIDNKPANKRALARAQAIHNAKIKNVKATSKSNAATRGLDFNQPTQYAHMMQNLNKRQKEDERFAEIEYENMLLLEKMSKIMAYDPRKATNYAVEITPGTRLSNSQSPTIDHYMSDGFLPGKGRPGKSLHATRRKLDNQRITQENLGLLKRIQTKEPVINRGKLLLNAQKQEEYLANSREHQDWRLASNSMLTASSPSQTQSGIMSESAGAMLYADQQLRQFDSPQSSPTVHGASGQLKSSKPRTLAPLVDSSKKKKPIKPLVLAGPSGSGKSTLINMLREEYSEHIAFCVSHTTRPPRAGEEDGVHYHFVSKEAFQRMTLKGSFLEHAEVHGHYYGTSKDAVAALSTDNKICVLDIDVQGVLAVQRAKLPAHYVFVSPPTLATLQDRLKARGTDSEETIQKRLRNAELEMNVALKSDIFDEIIVNDVAEAAYTLLKGVLSAELAYVNTLTGKAPIKIIIAGAPASGKGTQCEMITDKFGCVHLSTGDMLRAAVKDGTALGNQASAYMNAGQLVPDDLIIGLVKERLNQPDCLSKGWLLDGFPRTAEQAKALEISGIVPDVLIKLDVPDSSLVSRVVGRRSDPLTGKIYHVEFKPAETKEIADRLVQRSDDTEEKVLVRLEAYHAQINAIVGQYTSVCEPVDGDRAAKAVSADVLKILTRVQDRASADAAAAKASSSQRLADRGAKDPFRIIIAGAPASGKGTQCEMLVAKYGVVHISTGDLLRAAGDSGTPLGLKAASYMQSGNLVPDDLVIGLVTERLARSDCAQKGWLLDGFPRTADQAKALSKAGFMPNRFVYLDVPDSMLVSRVVGRRMDPQTGKIYHINYKPAESAAVKARLIQRDDDTEEKVKVRLQHFHASVDAIRAQYASILRRINGNQDPKRVFEDMDSYLDDGIPSSSPSGRTIVYLLGGPGSGKTTQAAKICDQFGFELLNAGDLMSAAIKQGAQSKIGTKLQLAIKESQQIPDNLLIRLFENAMNSSKKSSFLIDGFPRRAEHVAEFEATCGTGKFAVLLDCGDEMLLERLMAAEPSGSLASKQQQVKSYRLNSQAIITHLEQQGRLRTVDASGDAATVFTSLAPHFSASDSPCCLSIMGCVGSGTTTVSKALAEKKGFLYVHEGEAIMAAIKAGTPDGRLALAAMKAGTNMDGELKARIVRDSLSAAENSTASGYVLDAFPHTMGDVVAFEKICCPVTGVIYLEVDEKDLTARTVDQDEKTTAARLQKFKENSKPVVAHFAQRQKAHKVDASASALAVIEEAETQVDVLLASSGGADAQGSIDVTLQGPAGASGQISEELLKSMAEELGVSPDELTVEQVLDHAVADSLK